MAGAHLLPMCTICILHEVRGRVSPEGAGEQENAVRLLGSGTTWNAELQGHPKTLSVAIVMQNIYSTPFQFKRHAHL